MKRIYFTTLIFVICACNIFAQYYVPRREPIRKNLDAFMYAIDKIDAQHKEALSYRTAICNAYVDIVSRYNLSEEAEKRITEIKDASIKRIDNMALYGSYSYSLDTAIKEYGTVIPQMRKIAEDDVYNIEKQRIFRYTHPFDNMDYSMFTKVINNPTYESKQTLLKITRIAKSSSQTRIEFLCSNTVGNQSFGWVNIDRGVYLYDPIHKKKYPYVYSENISVAPNKTEFHFANEQLVFALIFTALPENIDQIDLIEPNGSDWIFNNIKVK